MISKEIRLVKEKINSNELTEDEFKQTPDYFFNEISVIDILDISTTIDLDFICKKLKKNGVLKINGIDIRSICRDIYYGNIDIKSASKVMTSVSNYNTISIFKEYFLNDNWKINFIGLQHYNYFVEVIKL